MFVPRSFQVAVGTDEFNICCDSCNTNDFFFFCSCTVITPSGSKKAEETKPKKPVLVLSLDTSKVKPKETKVMNVLKRTSDQFNFFKIPINRMVARWIDLLIF